MKDAFIISKDSAQFRRQPPQQQPFEQVVSNQ